MSNEKTLQQKADQLEEATIYAFKLLAAANGEPFSTCASFQIDNKPAQHKGASLYLSTWVIPGLEVASGLLYKEWRAEMERKMQADKVDRIVRTLRSLRNSMAAHPDCTSGSEFEDMVLSADRILNS